MSEVSGKSAIILRNGKAVFKDPDADSDYQNEPYPSWFWYGQFEGANGWYLTPLIGGPIAQLMYAAGNVFGRWFGHPRRRLLK